MFLLSVLLFFDVGGGELLLILIAVFLLFGPSKFPDIAKKMGEGVNKIKQATDDIKNEIDNSSENLKLDEKSFDFEENDERKQIEKNNNDLKE